MHRPSPILHTECRGLAMGLYRCLPHCPWSLPFLVEGASRNDLRLFICSAINLHVPVCRQ